MTRTVYFDWICNWPLVFNFTKMLRLYLFWNLNNLSIVLFRRESGLESFVPSSLAESMKKKELKKVIGHFLKVNGNLTAPGQKNLTALQAKLHYLKIISELPSYGAKCFSTTLSVSWLSNFPDWHGSTFWFREFFTLLMSYKVGFT